MRFLSTTFLKPTARADAQERELEARLKAAFAAEQLSGLHDVLVIHDGEILADCHFAGSDRRWRRAWGFRKSGQARLHGLRAITKSIDGLLYGIALAEDKVPAINQSLIAQFPEYADLTHEPRRKAILIKHALSMTMGTAWTEELPYLDPQNSETAMRYQEDPYRFVLDRPMVSEPGQSMVYNSGAVAVITRLIERGSGRSIDKYAEERLFEPLEIHSYEWVPSADGVPIGYSGLRLNIHDLAKIGQLLLQNGKFGGRCIVPANWLEASLTARQAHKWGMNYGYLWWLVPESWNGLPALMSVVDRRIGERWSGPCNSARAQADRGHIRRKLRRHGLREASHQDHDRVCRAGAEGQTRELTTPRQTAKAQPEQPCLLSSQLRACLAQL